MHAWVLIYTTDNVATANIIKGMLEQNEVPVSIINKQDSSYLNFGQIELYVPKLLKVLAANLISNAIVN